MQGSKRDTDVKNRLGLCGRRRGWDYLRDSIKTCILPYVKQMTSPSTMHETGHSKPLGGGSGVRDGRTHVHPWLIHVSVWQNAPQYCKVIRLQLK